ncbi:MAG TPA: cytochrome c [Gaiellaceae bacterium]|nr:cytochrome c [Gaiellaceae bacterium]
MARPRRRNPWTSVSEVLVWVLFAMLLFPAGFAGWAIGHYTSLGGGKGGGTKTVTVTAAASTQAATTTAATTTSAAKPSGDAAAGKTVFASNGCASCHTFKPAGATGTVGPDLDTAPAQDAQKAKMPLAAFLHESIVSPDAYVPSGYSKGIMPGTFGSSLSKSQLADLVAFLQSS